jgi:hypothetical protein
MSAVAVMSDPLREVDDREDDQDEDENSANAVTHV